MNIGIEIKGQRVIFYRQIKGISTAAIAFVMVALGACSFGNDDVHPPFPCPEDCVADPCSSFAEFPVPAPIDVSPIRWIGAGGEGCVDEVQSDFGVLRTCGLRRWRLQLDDAGDVEWIDVLNYSGDGSSWRWELNTLADGTVEMTQFLTSTSEVIRILTFTLLDEKWIRVVRTMPQQPRDLLVHDLSYDEMGRVTALDVSYRSGESMEVDGEQFDFEEASTFDVLGRATSIEMAIDDGKAPRQYVEFFSYEEERLTPIAADMDLGADGEIDERRHWNYGEDGQVLSVVRTDNSGSFVSERAISTNCCDGCGETE